MTAADSDVANGLGPVGDWEELGRCVFSRSQRRIAANAGVIPYEVFLERIGERKISVDRLNRTTPEEAAAKARRVGEQRNPARNFYGWAVIDAEQVRKAGCSVEHSPLLDNPYHADIVLPDSAMENQEKQEHYAFDLANMARWRPHPPRPGPETDDMAS